MSKAERRALTVLTALVVLGVATRSWRTYCGSAAPTNPAPSTAALDRQIQTVDSVRVETGRQPGAAPAARSGRGTGRGSRGRGAPKAKPIQEESAVPLAQGKLDLDRATAEEIEVALGIGPTLAKRIVADRTAHGTFGCLAQLRTVQGVGPAIMRRIDSVVTFSGLPRPTGGRCGS